MRRCFPKILSKLSNSSGVTLIELMVSLFIFAIGMLAVTAMCLISIQSNSLVNRMAQANFLAQSRMEELLNEPDMVALDLQDNLTQTGIDGNGNGSVGGNYSRSVDITTVVAEPNTRWVTVTTSWADAKGAHQVELKSLARGR